MLQRRGCLAKKLCLLHMMLASVQVVFSIEPAHVADLAPRASAIFTVTGMCGSARSVEESLLCALITGKAQQMLFTVAARCTRVLRLLLCRPGLTRTSNTVASSMHSMHVVFSEQTPTSPVAGTVQPADIVCTQTMGKRGCDMAQGEGCKASAGSVHTHSRLCLHLGAGP